MEDLESAIHRLNLAIEEHFTVDRTSMITLGDQDNIHDTLVKLLERFEEGIMTIGNLDETVTELTDAVKEIQKIQTRALKWQEMTQ